MAAETAPILALSPRRPSTRACDRCRRKKAKCINIDSSLVCTKCRLSGVRCTFDLPVAKRGPKTTRSRHAANNAPIVKTHQIDGHNTSPGRNSSSCSDTVTPSRPAPTDYLIPDLDPPRLTIPIPSPTTWETGRLALDSALSPQTAHTIGTPLSECSSKRAISATRRWHRLSSSLHLRDPLLNLDLVVNKCFSLFFEYLFPLIPLVHEPSLRDGLNFFVHLGHSSSNTDRIGMSETWTGEAGFSSNGSILPREDSFKPPDIWPDATFTLITAVCAEAAFLLPQEIFPEGESIAETFLHASRDCLASYLETDLEYPTANSVAVRYLHSNCVHASGKPRLSWHIFGEATRLAQEMQMNDEKSLQVLPPLEAELRRRAFWILYIGDKSAAILNNRPITMHKFSFESGITTVYPTGIEDNMQIESGTLSTDISTQKNFIAGFNANVCLWKTASDLILEMRLLVNQKEPTTIPKIDMTPEEWHRLDRLYVQFMTSIDKLPHYLQADILAASQDNLRTNNEHLSNGIYRQYLIQWTNIHVSLHCLKMVVTQKLEELDSCNPRSGNVDMSLLRKTEIARDLLRVIREAPFWSLQVNGEPCVEKIRLIGASLLEIIDQHENSPLAGRARKDLSVLLDILTRLDSKASDTLRRPL
ncbi:hypothetical protein BGW36DRAFT_419381 [Talaromyces proteolyticus]|uniref:Zn(2)-C6 fungal-type domain-containing protein n=1 Tax=Talaromyces proteolyticus TaxID=1131652 RepID=A0AAD4KIG4_9EURO|nr:uncharacterized protein BGW36DRAFT_419381 [Talaromyces proteolyticus]KAH8691987.1 hypothetical protein BGW36DRAFT_419381 [Talaromyces proteolyticus]